MRTRKWADKALGFVLGVVTAGVVAAIPSLYWGTAAQDKGNREPPGSSRSEKNPTYPCTGSEKEARGPRHD